MNGFDVWVAGPWSTLALVWAALAVGTVLGWGLGRRPRGVSRRERRDLADQAADRAVRQFRRLREPERRTSTAAFLSPPLTHSGPPEIAHEWKPADLPPAYARASLFLPLSSGELAAQDAWSEHVDQALDVASGDPITTGEIRAITEDMDVWLARTLGQHPVPYPDGSGQ